jgi:hypothetical protein
MAHSGCALVISAIAVALAVVLSHLLLDGSRMDQGLQVTVTAPATLAIAIGLGLLSRARLHILTYGSALALLVPLRGPLYELVDTAIPGGSAAWLAVVVSLAPAGLVLGRILSTLTQGSGPGTAAGWVLGELAVMAGVVSFLPGIATGLLMATAFAGLAEAGRDQRLHRDGGTTQDGSAAWEGAPFGFAVGMTWLTLRRVVPGYSTPPLHVGSEVALALLLPGVLVAWPASVLASGSAARRVLRMAGFLAVGYALWKLSGSLNLYRFSGSYVSVNTEIRQTAVRWGAPVTEWRGWLMVYCALPAAAFGVVLGCLSKAARAPSLLGLGVALAAESWVLQEPAYGPQQLLIAAAGVATLAALSGWRRLALIVVPAGVGAAAWIPMQDLATYEDIRRIGEPRVESSDRQLAADVALYSSGPSAISALQARRNYGTTFTDREPLGEVLELLGEPWSSSHDHGAEAEPLPIPLAFPLDDDEEGGQLEQATHYGLRFAGVAAHAGHDPMGAEGSLGRLNRLFGVPGRCLATGIGVEFVGGDLLDSGIATSVDASSAMPMGLRSQQVLFSLTGSVGFGLNVSRDPLHEARVALAGSYSMVVIAPERTEWPGAGVVSTEESLARYAELLAPGGRCLLWLDTDSLDVRSLRSRIASFGAVFGERSAAFLEMRELAAPYLLLLGWIDAAGQPRADELLARIPGPDVTGLRTRLWGLDDLGAMLLLDGAGIADVASSAARHRRSTPRPPSSFRETGWVAVSGLLGGARDLDSLVPGSAVRGHDLDDVVAGLAVHSLYDYDLGPLGGAMLIEVVDDVDWDAFDREAAHYVRASESDSENPLLQHALAGLLGPLARAGDATRFAEVFEATDAAGMRSWRLAALEAHVRRAGLQELEADEALERAARWAPWATAHHDHDH